MGYIVIGGVLWNNVIVTHLLGLYPFLGEHPKTVKKNGALGLVTTVAVMITLALGLAIRAALLAPRGLLYLEHLAIVLVFLAVLALFDRTARAVRHRRGALRSWVPEHLLPRVFLNSAALGVVVLQLENGGSAAEALVTALGLGLGVTVLLVLVQAIESRPETSLVPSWLRGMPLQFITLGMIALALKGFSGI